MQASHQRTLIWIGVVLSIIYCYGYAGLMGFFPPPEPGLPASDVATLYAAHGMQFRIGVALMLISGGFLLPWTLVISVQMARDEKGVPIWAILQALAGVLSTLIFFLPAIFWAAASFSPERDPALTKMMHELAFLTFITPVCVFPIQIIPIAVVALSHKDKPELSAFPRWLGYFTLWEAVIAEAGVAALLFKSGPFAWNGLFPFYLPIIVFTLWISAVFYTIFRALRLQEQALKA
jgi:hypothetical protein